MVYAQSPPLVEKEWLTAEELSSGGRRRDLDARSGQRIGMRPEKASIHSLHSFGRKRDQVASERPAIVQTLTLDRSDQPFGKAVLPG